MIRVILLLSLLAACQKPRATPSFSKAIPAATQVMPETRRSDIGLEYNDVVVLGFAGKKIDRAYMHSRVVLDRPGTLAETFRSDMKNPITAETVRYDIKAPKALAQDANLSDHINSRLESMASQIEYLDDVQAYSHFVADRLSALAETHKPKAQQAAMELNGVLKEFTIPTEHRWPDVTSQLSGPKDENIARKSISIQATISEGQSIQLSQAEQILTQAIQRKSHELYGNALRSLRTLNRSRILGGRIDLALSKYHANGFLSNSQLDTASKTLIDVYGLNATGLMSEERIAVNQIKLLQMQNPSLQRLAIAGIMLIGEQTQADVKNESERVDMKWRASEVVRHVLAGDENWLLDGILATFEFGVEKPADPRQEVQNRIVALMGSTQP